MIIMKEHIELKPQMLEWVPPREVREELSRHEDNPGQIQAAKEERIEKTRTRGHYG